MVTGFDGLALENQVLDRAYFGDFDHAHRRFTSCEVCKHSWKGFLPGACPCQSVLEVIRCPGS